MRLRRLRAAFARLSKGEVRLAAGAACAISGVGQLPDLRTYWGRPS